MKRLYWTVLHSLMFSCFFTCCTKTAPKEMTVAYSNAWGDLNPPMQRTYNAAVILVNIFQPLIAQNHSGGFDGVGAKHWTVSDDNQKITFEIDTRNRFSDGSTLSAQDYKDSWERGLQLIPKSFNNSLRDVLYKVEGFSSYERTKTISGIVVKGDSLEINFSTPYRSALEELSGARFAAFKIVGDKFIGSGAYFIESQKNEISASLAPNPYASEIISEKKINLKIIKESEAAEALKDEKIDVFVGTRIDPTMLEILKNDKFKLRNGEYTAHETLALNGQQNRFFSDIRLRQGFHCIFASITRDREQLTVRQGFKYDLQTYLSFQSGRMQNIKVKDALVSHCKHRDFFVRESKKRPLYFLYAKIDQWLRLELEKKGIHFTKNSGLLSESGVDYWEETTKNFRTDILSMAFSVSNGDPDGIYHKLGKHGAIHTPIVYRPEVSDQLEKGRKLLKQSDLNQHYQKVSATILRELPYVHKGFRTSFILYNASKVRVEETILHRNDSYLNGLRLK